MIQNFRSDSYSAVKIVEHIGQIIGVPYQLHAVNLDHMDGINTSIQAHR